MEVSNIKQQYNKEEVRKIDYVPKAIPKMATKHYEQPTSSGSHKAKQKKDTDEEVKDVQVNMVSPELDNVIVTEPPRQVQQKAPRIKMSRGKKKKKDEIEYSPSLSVQKISEKSACIDKTDKINYKHDINIDNEMFTRYKIDGIDEPFGGFVFEQQNSASKQQELMHIGFSNGASLRMIRKFYEENDSQITDPDQVPILRVKQTSGREDVLFASRTEGLGKSGRMGHIEKMRMHNVNYTPHEPFQETVAQGENVVFSLKK